MAVFDWIDVFYSCVGIHSALDYLAPAEYEERFSWRQSRGLISHRPPSGLLVKVVRILIR
jgi:hypothetical protein